MRINEIHSKEVNVTLSADELVMLGNLLYFYENHYDADPNVSAPGPRFYELAEQVVIARDLCQYGHLDTFSLDSALRYSIAADPERRLSSVKLTLGITDKTNYMEDRLKQIKEQEKGKEV